MDPLCQSRTDQELKRALDGFVATVDAGRLSAQDPVGLVKAYSDPHDQEVAGLIVASLAYGRVRSIRAAAAKVLLLLAPRPAEAIRRTSRREALAGFVYRFQSGSDLPRFLGALAAVRKKHGSLANAFFLGMEPNPTDYLLAMEHFMGRLRKAAGPQLSPGLEFLLPRVDVQGSSAKRLCLFLRWMIRDPGPADLGAWGRLLPGVFEPAKLIIPLDTHIDRIGRYIGLTDRQTAGMKTAREITARLRRLRPEDPLAYDLALCHLGISGSCPRRRDPVCCAGCPIRAICRLGPEPKGFVTGGDPVAKAT